MRYVDNTLDARAGDPLFAGPGAARALARRVDWGASGAGAPDRWPEALRAAVRICLASPTPASVWLGPGHVLVHNDAYAELLGSRASWAMGRTAAEVWSEVWPRLAPEFGEVLRSGAAFQHADAPFLVRRSGRDEEVFFTFSLSPIQDDAGRTLGIFNVSQESSSAVAALGHTERELRDSEARSRRQLAELQSIYDSAHIGLCVFDRELRFVRINQRLAEINGIPAGEHIGKTVQEVVPALARAAREIVDRILRTGAPVTDVEFRGTTPSLPGVERVWVEQWLPLKDASGEVTGVNVVVEEVTERRRSEEALRASEDRLRAMADALPALVHVHDSGGANTWVNRRWCDFAGLPPERLLGKASSDLVHPEDLERLAPVLPEAVERRRAFECEYRLRRHDGEWRWHLARSVPWKFAPDGAPSEWVGTSTDITDLKRAEHAVARSERRHAVMFRRSPVAMAWIRLPEGTFADVNDAWSELMGISREEALGRTSSALGIIPEDERRAYYARLLAHGATAAEVTVATRGKGSRIALVGAEVVPLGAERYMLAVLQDVTELRRAEQALRDSEERLSLALEASRVGTWEYDPARQRFEWSPLCRALLGVAEDGPVTYARFVEALHPEDRARAEEAVARALDPGGDGVYAAQFRARWPDGTLHWLSAFGRVEFAAEAGARRATRARGAVVDVTREKEAELAVRDADRRKTEFLAMLSHELRNPLAPIRNSIVLLEGAPAGSDAARRARDVLRRQSEHLARLVDDLLDVSRIAHGKIEVELVAADVRELVRRAYLDAKGLFEARDVELLLSEASEPVWVAVDAARFSQMVGNLLHNALKFTPPRGRVELKVLRQGAAGEVRVRDTGQGLDPADLERIFDPFQQALRTRDGGGGMGLGLALVKGLAEKHGGSARACSDGPGKGAEFVISLPLAPAPASRLGLATAPGATRAPPLDIVIVEDNEDAAATLADLLALGGHTVTTATTGDAGVRAVVARRPDVVICDVGLPDMSGHDVIRAIRTRERGTRVFATALTGYAQPHDREAALSAGFDAHLPKPPPLEELEALLLGVAQRN